MRRKLGVVLICIVKVSNQSWIIAEMILQLLSLFQTEVAQQLSFGVKTAVLLSMEHYRPRLRYLKPDSKLNIPSEFTHYLENYYYTEKISK